MSNTNDERIEAVLAAINEGIMDKEAYSTMILENLKPCIDAIAAEMQRITNIFAEALRPVSEAIIEVGRHMWDATARACVPSKWWHIYTHTKKARIRKKYRDRITRAVLEALAADGGGEE